MRLPILAHRVGRRGGCPLQLVVIAEVIAEGIATHPEERNRGVD